MYLIFFHFFAAYSPTCVDILTEQNHVYILHYVQNHSMWFSAGIKYVNM